MTEREIGRALPKDWPKVRKITVHGRIRWQVDARPHEKRSVHATESLARGHAWKVRLSVTGEAAQPLEISHRVDAARAIRLLPPGTTLFEAVKAFVANRAEHGTRLFAEVAPLYEAHCLAAVKARRLCSPGYRNVRWGLKKLLQHFPDARVMDIEPKAQEYIDGLAMAPATKSSMLKILHSAWAWLIENKYAIVNPWGRVKIERHETSVSILTPDEAAKLLTTCSPHPAALKYALLGLACGLRPDEALKFKPKHLAGNATLHISNDIAKTGQERFITIDPMVYKQLAEPGTWASDLPLNQWKNVLWPQVRKEAGFGNGPGLTKWPQDVLRHSFASYHLPIHKNRAALAEHMGNSVDIIKKHYRRPVPVEQAQRYWDVVTPQHP